MKKNVAIAGGIIKSETGGAEPVLSDADFEGAPNSEPQDEPQFHSLAAIFPLMEGAGLGALTDDIRAHGLVEPIILHEGRILDGRNRYLACRGARVQPTYRQFRGDDPLAYVVSANLHRRHLTRQQKHMIAESLLRANPERSNNTTAKLAKLSDKTVANIRTELESTSEIPKLTKTTGADGKARPARQPRSKTRSINRSMQLGAEVVASLEGTSLRTAREQDELLILNRRAAPGELTPLVRDLVDRAVAGENVSALAEAAKITAGRLQPRSKTKTPEPSLLETWESMLEERLEEFFATAEGADILERIPAERRTEVVRGLLDQLGVDGMRAAMSPEFGQQLRAALPKHQPGKSEKKKFQTMRMEPIGTDASGNPVFAHGRGNRSQH